LLAEIEVLKHQKAELLARDRKGVAERFQLQLEITRLQQESSSSSSGGGGESAVIIAALRKELADERAKGNVAALRVKLEEVKGMRDGLKDEVKQQLMSFTSEMGAAVAALAKTSVSTSGGSGGGVGGGDVEALENKESLLLERAEAAEATSQVLTMRVKRLENDLEESRNEALISKKQLDAMTREVEEAKSQLTAAAAKSVEAEEKNELATSAQARIAELESTLITQQKLQTSAVDEIKAQLQELEAQASEDRAYAQQKAQEALNAKALEKQATDLVASLQAQVAQLNELPPADAQSELLGTLEQQVQTLEAQRAHSVVENARLQKLLDDASSQLEQSQSVEARLSMEKQQAEEQATAKMLEYQKLTDAHEAQLDALRVQVADGERKYAEMEKAKNKLEEENARLVEEMKSQVAALEALGVEKLEALKAQIAEQEASKGKLVEETSQQIKKLQAQVVALQTEGGKVSEAQTRIEELEGLLQTRIVENATLHEQLRNASTKNDALETSDKEAKQRASKLEQEIMQCKQRLEETASDYSKQLDASREDLNQTSSVLEAVTGELQVTQAKLLALSAEIEAALEKEAVYLRQLESASEAVARAEAAEETLSKLEDKKKRDLEFLKKQNEKIAALQREHTDTLAAAEETILDLRKQLSVFSDREAIMADQHNGRIAELQGQCAAALEEASLANQNAEAARIELERALAEAAAATEALAAAEAAAAIAEQSPSTLSTHSEGSWVDLMNENSKFKEDLVAFEQRNSTLAKQLESAEASTAQHREASRKAEGELKQLFARVTALENERARLESELSDATNSQVSLQRQRPERGQQQQDGLDLEGGGSNSKPAARSSSSVGGDDDLGFDDKKSSLGLHPLILQFWSLMHQHCPIQVIQVVGDKPPRLSLVSQGLLVYALLAHLMLFYLLFVRNCSSASSSAAPEHVLSSLNS